MSDTLHFRYEGGWHELLDWSLVHLRGEDRWHFMQGQTTQDLTELSEKRAVLTCRLDRTGRLKSFFYAITKLEGQDYLLIPRALVEATLEDLNKYIIMDDVELEPAQAKAYLLFGKLALESDDSGPWLNFFDDDARLSLSLPNEIDTSARVSSEALEKLRMLNGWPKWGEEISEKNFINDCRLNEVAISYQKGCFLGQETVAKIQNNRGAAHYPVLIELVPGAKSYASSDHLIVGEEKIGWVLYHFAFSGKAYVGAMIKRDYRVHGLDLHDLGRVKYFPFFEDRTCEEKSNALFEKGAQIFQEGSEQEAIELLQLALKFNPLNTDAYESLGVIYGRLEKFEEAIALMDQLEKLDPSSVMAHTNRSLYLMRLGRIEEAEEQKSKATLKSFAMYGKEAQDQALKQEQKALEEQKMAERQQMFEEVLSIDPEDDIANYGLADIHFYYHRYEEAAGQLKRLIQAHPQYSKAYLLLGKCREALGQNEEAKAIYAEGIRIATKRGELMPANEMQARLSRLG